MAGEIEEPFRLNFQAESFRSGSISFGRYENEALCWERRSSFSHNRYLEEVEKCSKPGLVIEKKAYFEAHFRKKGIMGLSPLESQNETVYQTSENDILEKTSYNDNNINHMNTETNSPRFDDILDGSVYGPENDVMENEREASETSISEARVDLLCDTENISEEIEVKEKTVGEAANADACHVSNETISQFSHSHATQEDSDASPIDQQDSSLKEKIPSQDEYMKPIRVSDAKSGRSISGKASKGSERIPGKSVKKGLMRSKPEKKTSEAVGQDKRHVHVKPKDKLRPKARGVNEIIRGGGKESRNRRVEGPRSSTLQNVSSRVIPSENRIKPAVVATQPRVKQDTSKLRFKCNERVERRKEFDIKLEKKMPAKEADKHQLKAKTQDKTETERKQVRKSLNFKATPLPSFYRESDRNKDVTTNIRPQKQQTKSSTVRIPDSSRLRYAADKNSAIFMNRHPKTTDIPPPATSAATSCHSTVTSDSNPSSPAAEIGKSLPSQEVISSRIGGRKDKVEEKNHKSLHKHKAIERNKLYKGKTIDGKRRRNVHCKFKVPMQEVISK